MLTGMTVSPEMSFRIRSPIAMATSFSSQSHNKKQHHTKHEREHDEKHHGSLVPTLNALSLHLLWRLRLSPAKRLADCLKSSDDNLENWNHALSGQPMVSII
jgi:hypothetical protein